MSQGHFIACRLRYLTHRMPRSPQLLTGFGIEGLQVSAKMTEVRCLVTCGNAMVPNHFY